METTINYNGYTIKIIQDAYSYNPLNEFDLLGSITYNPRARTILGNTPMEAKEVDRILNSNDYIAIPVFAYVHSGATVKASETNPFNCPWDSGQSGIIFVSKEKVRKEYGLKRVSPQRVEKVKEILRDEVELFDDYLTGNVYGYQIKETGDSCWGFIGDPEKSGCIEEAKNIIDYLVKEDKELAKK